MRSSISAQSCDSVPPAPGWMVTMALARSCSPPSIFLISAASTSCFERRRAPRCRSAATSSPASAHSSSTARSSIGGSASRAASRSSLEPAAALQDLLRFGLVLPEVGAAMRRFERASSSAIVGASKIAPQIAAALHQIFANGASDRPVCMRHVPAPCHGVSAAAATSDPGHGQRRRRRGRTAPRDRQLSHTPSGACRNRASPTTTAVLEHAVPHEDAAVRIDDAADAGVGGAHQIAALLDRPHRRQLEVLIRRRRVAEPGVVGDRRQQLAALAHRLAHQVRDRRPRSRSRC